MRFDYGQRRNVARPVTQRQWAARWAFASTPKLHPDIARSAPPGDMLARVRALAPRLPITRLSDLTPLDPLRLPVYCAVTPLARDLTTHLGKGATPEHAQISALMEAVERVVAERAARPVRRATWRQISCSADAAIHPHEFDLPPDTRFRERRTISWIEGWDLVKGEPVWVPLDVAITPAVEGVLPRADTNGLAAGADWLDAVVHALCEVIERDAFGIWLFRSTFGDSDERSRGPRPIDLDSLPEVCQPWLARLRESGLSIDVGILPSDTRVPVFRTVLTDPAFPSSNGLPTRRAFAGLGAGPNARAAVLRSITEAVQSRVAVVQGARDSYNVLSPPRRAAAVDAIERDAPASFDEVPSFATTDLFEELRFLLTRLSEAGFERVVAVDLSPPDLGAAVVRVRVPGMSAFAIDRRRRGWRCLRYLL